MNATSPTICCCSALSASASGRPDYFGLLAAALLDNKGLGSPYYNFTALKMFNSGGFRSQIEIRMQCVLVPRHTASMLCGT